MKELITAKRIGFDTNLRWIRTANGVVVEVVSEDDITTSIHSIDELLRLYTPVPSADMFKAFVFRSDMKNVNKNADKNKKKDHMKDNEKSQTIHKERVPTNRPTTIQTKSAVFSNIVEVSYDIEGYKNGELKFVMEVFSYKDVEEVSSKMKNENPDWNFRLVTKRSVVSYEEL